MIVPRGKSLTNYIQELKGRRSVQYLIVSTVSRLKKVIEGRFSKLDLDDHPARVCPYHVDNERKIITDALLAFDPDFNVKIQSKGG